MEGLKKIVADLIKLNDGVRNLSRKVGIDSGYLCRLKQGDKTNPSDEVLEKLNIQKVVTYRTGPPQ